MSTYNLNDNVKDSFEFSLNGNTYTMRYPTVEETEQFQDAVKKEDEKSMLAMMYQFITPDIAEVLPKQNIKVIQNFTEMIKAEFGA